MNTCLQCIKAKNPSFKQKIAACFNLDPEDPSTPFWRETVSNEINVAVVRSFNSAGASIVDTHSLSDQFMEFFRGEHQARGGCPSDWVRNNE